MSLVILPISRDHNGWAVNKLTIEGWPPRYQDLDTFYPTLDSMPDFIREPLSVLMLVRIEGDEEVELHDVGIRRGQNKFWVYIPDRFSHPQE